jgi:RNA polymerase sigma-70 factor (ECF subfamily)
VDQELHQLIQAAKSKNKQAFEELVRRFKGQVYRQAYGMLKDPVQAEDIVQEAFVKIYYSLSKLESPYAFSTWLNRIVVNLCYDWIEKRKKEQAYVADWLDQYHDKPHQQEVLEQKRLQMSIEEALNKLTPEHRAVVLLRDVQGYSYEEIAHILKIPKGTVKSRLHMARLLLRQEMMKGEAT